MLGNSAINALKNALDADSIRSSELMGLVLMVKASASLV
jgi:hypothetical protein